MGLYIVPEGISGLSILADKHGHLDATITKICSNPKHSKKI
jgi:hypothetical protein